MFQDRFDRLLFAGLLLTVAVLAGLLITAPIDASHVSGRVMDRQLEQEMSYQARIAFLTRRYQPVIDQLGQGALPEALLTLEEISRDLPGEVHSDLLRGDVFFRMGQLDRALTNLAVAVRQNPDYVDSASPLNQRQLIDAVVSQGMPQLRDRLRAQPGNRSLEQVLKDGYYLQSRLAGGCE
ncbi:MAG: hypothetical protein JRE16_09595 [Deltaproteobacteria bacterium]|jgi:predicted Zn-dependent protease|nr:hypothetical protein [Deltaproteobacteria bacterium]MBW2504809.1 hypothetical protein [Deltaproteobacteria bacterium]